MPRVGCVWRRDGVPDARLPRRARLRTKADFDRVFAQSEKSTDRFFTVLYRPNQLLLARLGLVVSRRTAKKAVVRNRIKRLVRESFRHHHQRLHGLDIVVISRPSLTDQDNAAVRASLLQHWARLTRACEPCCSR